jgi:hypothetical protein
MPQRHRPELSEAVTGEHFVGYRRSARTFGRDRVCTHEGCATRLSMYNSGDLCAVHTSFRSAGADATLRIMPDVHDPLEMDDAAGKPLVPPGGRTRRRRAPHTEPPPHRAAS